MNQHCQYLKEHLAAVQRTRHRFCFIMGSTAKLGQLSCKIKPIKQSNLTLEGLFCS